MQFSKLYFILYTILSGYSAIAQVNSYGRTIIENKGEMHIFKHYTFQHLNQKNNYGVVATERGQNKSYISFYPGGTWSGADDKAFVDGYVRSYQSEPFIFPVGDNNLFRPVKIEKASISLPTEAAYYGVNPSLAITSSFWGSSNTVLPLDGPFSNTNKEFILSQVSNKEYWDINGSIPTRLTLSWNLSSEVRRMTGGALKTLTIVGWNGTEWVAIPSQMDISSVFDKPSELNRGSITTINEINLNDYSVYSLGSIKTSKLELFLSKATKTQVLQSSTMRVELDIDTNVAYNEDNEVFIHHSRPNYGSLSSIDKKGYNYNAYYNTLGIDTVTSVAHIFNKSSVLFSYDTFRNEIVVKYYQKDTLLDLSNSTKTLVGKPLIYPSNVSIDYKLQSYKGLIEDKKNGTYEYTNEEKAYTDSLAYILIANYKSIGLQTADTSYYYIKLREKYKFETIQNLISPNGDGSNDVWEMPRAMLEDYPSIHIMVSSLDGKIVWLHKGEYKNDWGANNLAAGLYLYYIQLDSDNTLSGRLRIER